MTPDVGSSEEFGPKQALMFALAGTVALPCPKPATGKVYLGHSTTSAPKDAEGAFVPDYYLKSVQVVSDSMQIVRIVALRDIRAIEFPKKHAATGHYQSFEIKILTHPDVSGVIATAKKSLEAHKGSGEVPLFDQAVLHVAESAPCYVRITREFAVTAAVAAENIVAGNDDLIGPGCDC